MGKIDCLECNKLICICPKKILKLDNNNNKNFIGRMSSKILSESRISNSSNISDDSWIFLVIEDTLDVRNSQKRIIDQAIANTLMKFMSGSDAIRFIRKLQINNKTSKFNICTITAFEDKDSISIIKGNGSDLILKKPVCRKDIDNFFVEFPLVSKKEDKGNSGDNQDIKEEKKENNLDDY